MKHGNISLTRNEILQNGGTHIEVTNAIWRRCNSQAFARNRSLNFRMLLKYNSKRRFFEVAAWRGGLSAALVVRGSHVQAHASFVPFFFVLSHCLDYYKDKYIKKIYNLILKIFNNMQKNTL